MATAQYSLKLMGGGMQTISTQSTAVVLSTTSKPCQMVTIIGVSTNTAPIMIADSTVKLATTARVGVPCYWGSTAHPVTVYTTDVQNLYIDGVSTEAVSYVYYGLAVPS